MKTNENTITQMGILSELVYNDKKDDNGMNIEYFKEGVILTAGETKYKVIDSTSNYTLWGFNALLLKNEATGDYTIAFRGTELASPADILSDIMSGALNFNPQYSEALIFTNRSLQKIASEKSCSIDEAKQYLTLTGHSLGGILTQAVGANFHIKGYAYNPFGASVISQDIGMPFLLNYIYAKIEGVFESIGLSSNHFKWARENIFTVSYQDEGIINGDVLSNFLTLSMSNHLGKFIPIFGKNVGAGDGHSIVNLNKYIEEYNNTLKHFNSNITYKELTEAYLSTAMIHKGKGYEKLNEEFKKIGVFESKDDSLNLDIITTTLNLQNAFSPTHITTPALYALVHLNPFIVSGVDSPAYKELEKYKDEYSDNYIKDKTVMFQKALDGKAAINGIYFKDYESNLDLDTTQDFNGMHDEYHFGTNSNDTIEPIGTKISLDKNRIYALGGDDHIKAPNGSNYIEAGSGNDTIDLRDSQGENVVYGGVNNGKDNDDDGDDIIYGGQGKDTIYGGNGKDTIYTDNDDKEDLLYGGDGFDTYYVGDKDVIFDSDGKGKVVFDGVELKGGTYDKDKGVYASKDGLIEYRLNESGGKSTLTVQKGGKSITINEFNKEDKSLGVELYGGKITVSISDSSAIESAQTMKFDISLDRKLEGDEYIILRVNDKKYLFGTPPKDGNINEDMFDSISSDGKTIVYNYEWKNDEIPQGDRDFIVAPVVEGASNNLTVNSIKPAKGTIKDDDRKPNEPDPEYYDPIIIDLNKDGTTTSKLNGAVNFDIDSNGFKEATGWISKDDAFLAYDRNGNGKIDNGSELFGDKTIADTQRGYTSKTAKNGFEALKAFDTNHDNIIDERDEEFNKLLLWQDKNSNAVTDEGELKTLKEHNVKSIDLRYKETQIDNNGNLIKQTSTVTFNDNTTTTADDVWFKVDLKDTEQPDMDLSLDIKALPEVYAFGNIYNLKNAMSMDNGLADAVRGYIALNQETREKQIDNLIFKWAETENADINSRGGYIDARVLAVYEKMTGKPFYHQSFGPNPNSSVARMLNDIYKEFKDYVFASIELQTTYKGLIDTKYQYYDYDANKYGYDFSKVNSKIRELYSEQKYEEIAKINGLIKQAATYRDNLLTSFEENLIKLAGDSEHFRYVAMSNYIKGIDGDDTINGSNANDWIEGGKGNDTINGGDGDDTYVYSKGDGYDIIYDTRGTNKIKFKDVTKNEADFLREGNSLALKIKDTNEKITIYDFFNHNTQATISIFEFADGNTTMANEIRAFNLIGDDGDNSIHGFVSDDTLRGNKGNDKLYGGWGNDTYVFNKGDGKDIIEDSSGLDAIKFENGINPEDVLLTRELGKLVINVVDKDKNPTGDSITVENFFSLSKDIESGAIENIIFSTGEKWGINKILEKAALAATNYKDALYLTSKDDVFDALGGDDEIYGGYGDDTLYGNEGNDVLHGDLGNDTLIGGRGNDQLYGESGDDTYIFGRNWGNDTIIENYYDRNNIIKFTDNITKNDLVFNRNDRDLIISDKAGANSICVKDVFYLSYDYAQLNSKISKIVFADGSEILEKDFIDPLLINPTDNDDKLVGAFDAGYTIDGKGGNDTITTNKGNDTLIGGKGNDTLMGGEGDDTYIYKKGDGNDIIRDLNGNNTICFKDIGRDSIEFLKNDYDLIVKIKENDETITIKNVLSGHQIDRGNFAFKFMDESIMGIQEVKFYLTGDDQDNTLRGCYGNDTLVGKKGNDILYGRGGDDTYIYRKGDGSDIIYDAQGNNTIDFKDILRSEVDFVKSNSDLLVKIKDTNEQITIRNFFSSESSSMNFKFADGNILQSDQIKAEGLIGDNNDNMIQGYDSNDILKGNGGNDTLYGGKGNDTLEGGKGNDILVGNTGVDTYVFGRGDGQDVIYALDADYGRFNIDANGNYNISYYYNQQNVKGTDIIKFKEGITKNDLIFERAGANGHDLLIKIKDTNDSITVKDMFSDAVSSKGIDKIEFADGSFMSTDDIYKNTPLTINRADQERTNGSVYSDTIIGNDQNNIIYGKDGNDVIYGHEGDDKLYGDTGDDTLTGGKGNDYLDGGDGNDVYIYNKGDGSDTIYDAGGTDTIKFAQGISKQDLIVKRSERVNANGRKEYSDIKISFKNSPNDSIIIKDVIASNKVTEENKIETFELENGEKLNFEDIKKLSLIGSNESDTLIGYVHSHNIMSGNEGNDKLYGQGWNDTMDGGEGDDIIESGSGNDTLIGGTGNDTLNGGIGDDVYIYNKGDGKDTIIDGGGTDVIKFGQGINKEDLIATKIGKGYYGDIVLTFANSQNDSITIKNIILAGEINNANKIEALEFANGKKLKIEDIKLNIIGTEENDNMRGYDGFSNIIKGNGGNDNIQGGALNDTIYGGDGDDYINGYDGDDILYGGNGKDSLYGREGNDTLIGGEGNDELWGESGDDVIDGGNGNDTLYGGEGEDTYIFGRGDGQDIVYADGNDTIKFKAGITQDDLIFKRVTPVLWEDHLMIQVKDTQDHILIKNAFKEENGSREIRKIEFDNGVSMDFNEIKQKMLMTPSGDSSLIDGFNSDDTIVGGDINNQIYGYGGDDTLYGGKGDDSLYGQADNDTLYGGEGNDNLYGDEGSDKLYGGEGEDKLCGGDGDDILSGDAGNDTLCGENGADTYIFGKGDGHDVVSSDEADTIRLKEGISKDDIAIQRLNNNDLRLLIKQTGDSMMVYNIFSKEYPSGISKIEFSDGSFIDSENIKKIASDNTVFFVDNSNTSLNGSSNNDILYGDDRNNYIYGDAGSDILIGGKGNDGLDGGEGADTYVFAKGDGNDTISADGNDIIKFKEGISKDDLLITREYSNLKINFKNSDDSITVSGMFYEADGNSQGIKAIEFSDGSSLSLEDIRKTVLANNDSADIHDIIYGFNTDDVIMGSSQMNFIRARGGNDTVYGKEGNDTISGDAGNDLLIGGEGDDTYEYNMGDGNDTIDNTGGGNDTILFSYDISKDDISFKKDGNDLIVTVNKDSSQTIKVKDHFLGGDYAIDQIKFVSNGSVLSGKDILKLMNTVHLTSEGGNNNLVDKGQKDNVYTYAGGRVTISDNGGYDKVIFKNKTYSVNYSKKGDNLLISANKITASNNNVLEVKDFFKGANHIIEDFDLSEYSLVTARRIYEDFGITYPVAQSKQEVLAGGKEDNVYIYTGGRKIIDDKGGNDRVVFQGLEEGLFYRQKGNNLLISTKKMTTDNEDVLEVKNFFSNKNSIIEEFQITDYWSVSARKIYEDFDETYPVSTDTQNAPLALLGTTNKNNEASLNDSASDM